MIQAIFVLYTSRPVSLEAHLHNRRYKQNHVLYLILLSCFVFPPICRDWLAGVSPDYMSEGSLNGAIFCRFLADIDDNAEGNIILGLHPVRLEYVWI